MNIRIFQPWKKLPNIWTNEHICLNIFEYIRISKYWSNTGLVLSMIIFLLNMNGFFLNMNGFVLNMIGFSKLRPSGPMLSISQNVCLRVRLCVCLSVCLLLRYCLNVFLPPLPQVRCPKSKSFRDSESFGKISGKKLCQI